MSIQTFQLTNNVFRRAVRPLAMTATMFIALTTSVWAQDASGIKNIKDANLDLMNNHDPASEQENFELLDGYQVNLFASDPMLANPTHMHWDSRGRLWVSCSWAYPQLKPGEVANDKIIILEDTDDDGVADKSTVFADGLYIPTGLELANGGCYVAQSPDVFFFKDTDGDDVADVKELALTGFGIEDSHHSVSAWRRGPGGWIYFQEGIFLHSQVETQHGVVRNFNGGVYQYNPRTQELRMFCTGTGGNPWGHVFDQWGQSFMVNNPRIMYLSPVTGNGAQSIRVPTLISTEKQCGGDLATGSHVGDDIRGNLLSGRFKSRTIIRYEFTEDGAGFSANVLPPLMTCKHPNFRPVDVKIGPDGAIYVADWYNSIINHASHDFRDPRRDHEHGRIWRITHKDRPLVKKPKFDGTTTEQLVDHLKSSETWVRHQAKKEISERDPDEVLAVLQSWVDGLDTESPDYDLHLVEAMWACQNVERPSEKILKLVLDAKDGHARSAGARVIRYWHESLSDPIAMIAKAAADPFPRTRMEAVLSAGFIPQAEAYAAALNVIDHPSDPFLDLALPQTAKALEPYWRPAMEAGTLRFAKASHKAVAEQSAGIGFAERIGSFLQQKDPSEKEIKEFGEQFISMGTQDDILRVVASLTSGKDPRSDDATIVLLESLESMANSRQSGVLRRRLRALTRLLDNDNATIASLAAENLAAWKVSRVTGPLLDIVESDSRPAALRRSAAVAFAKLGGAKERQTLAGLAEHRDPETRYCALVGLVATDVQQGTKSAATLFSQDPGQADPVPLIQAILKDKNGLSVFSDALKGVEIHPAVADRVDEFHRSTGLLPENLAKRFRPSSDSESLNSQLLAEDLAQLTRDVETYGDAVRGENIYRRKSLSCTSCHGIGPVGPVIGPNLVAVGAAAKTDYIVESILRPNKAIAEHYENRMYVLDDGTTQTGIVTFESDDEVVVRDAAQGGKEIRLAADEIIAEKAMNSAMPAGLVDQLASRQEFLDLAKFVAALGRPGDFSNDESPVIRKWKLTSISNLDELPVDDAQWITVYSKVNGELPAGEMPSGAQVLARGYLNVQVSGGVQLKTNDMHGLRLWVDGDEVIDPSNDIKLAKGRHAISVVIDRNKRGDTGLKVEPIASPKTPAKFQIEGGF
ncbi:membrane-bound dehydrogenase domain-containing protein [Rhodopirellula maiorica SM1]|uniref:Membrane-bound dehydrogenase domain-containing protein n=1 Tax=Rhodopirellula maiorica SM1 TaxID=1265738 RepID=M5S690_9BACT|nr:PVC-type heme-binding CxxCH protein [Rhodopirellula maiorica]EMI21709.1 membrane-bound dehydrogenase domain-containing protein [Rhodopirellula maiorica SM1]